MKRSPLRRVSKKRAVQNRTYTKIREEFLADNPKCGVCEIKKSTQIHHRRGRFGDRLNDTAYFMAICFDCHNKIHLNPSWAYAKDYLITR